MTPYATRHSPRLPLLQVLAGLVLLAAAAITAARWQGVTAQGLVGADLTAYRLFAERFLATGSQYAAHQLAGPYDSQPAVWTTALPSMYPPTALALFVPFVALPAVLWWAIPAAVTVWALRDARPPRWTWLPIAACLAWPETTTMVMVGNTTMWGVAAVAAGLRWGWPVVALAVKPTLVPFAIVGLWRRSTWVVGTLAAVASLAFLPEWSRWLVAVANGTAGAGYSLGSVPALLIPVLAGQRASKAITFEAAPVRPKAAAPNAAP